MARYRVFSNGCGGYKVIQKRKGANIEIGGGCSHRSNANIKASRLNGERDTNTPLAEWIRFYGA